MKISPNSGLSDVEVLTKSFRTEFKFEANVNVVITFQRFDPDWDETVDLESESVINDKDKLIAVVTPLLVTPFTSPVESCVEKVIAVEPIIVLSTLGYPMWRFKPFTTLHLFA